MDPNLQYLSNAFATAVGALKTALNIQDLSRQVMQTELFNFMQPIIEAAGLLHKKPDNYHTLLKSQVALARQKYHVTKQVVAQAESDGSDDAVLEVGNKLLDVLDVWGDIGLIQSMLATHKSKPIPKSSLETVMGDNLKHAAAALPLLVKDTTDDTQVGTLALLEGLPAESSVALAAWLHLVGDVVRYVVVLVVL